jgi:hypothetical protein
LGFLTGKPWKIIETHGVSPNICVLGANGVKINAGEQESLVVVAFIKASSNFKSHPVHQNAKDEGILWRNS